MKKKLTIAQVIPVGVWFVKRRFRYFFWRLVNQYFALPAKFKKVGSSPKFNGLVRVEKPLSEIYLGDNVLVGIKCYFLTAEEGFIKIGDSSTVNDFCYITSCYGITIGKNVSIAEQVSIRDFDHAFGDLTKTIQEQGMVGSPIIIEDDVWIGRGVMITSGVTIGKGAVIGANAVVTKNIEPYSIAVGVPARVIKSRKPA